jgi:hypothetical protein
MFYIKQNDTGPSIQATLKDADGVAVSLAGATVSFKMRKQGSATPKVNAAATIVNSTAGIVKYNWIAADTNTVGTYQAEFQVTYSDLSVETFPNATYLKVKVIDDIA